MKKFTYLVTLVGYMLIMPLAIVLAQAKGTLVGVNLENAPDRLSPSEQDAILDAMKGAGVRVVRAGIVDDDQDLDFVQRVYARGMKIEGLTGVRGPSGNMPLSSADPDKFRAYFQPFLAKLESKGIVFAGIELGTEINWGLWNRNISGTTGRVLGLADLSHDPEGQQIAKGYIQYVKVLAALKNIRDRSKLNQRTPIISAGLAPWEPPSTGQKRDAVGLIATIQFLRANGVDQFVDAYGIHWYPQGNATPAARLSDLQQILSECGTGSGGRKPCWITEWGLPVSSGKSCPVVDVKRTAIFSELRNDFSQFVQQDRLEAIIFYTWQGDIHDEDPYSAFLCGALTKSGRLAFAPL